MRFAKQENRKLARISIGQTKNHVVKKARRILENPRAVSKWPEFLFSVGQS
jgi:hypothetical protein